MPWTRKAVKFLLSKGSTLTPQQQDKMKAELHSDPSLGHAQKKSDKQSHHFDWRRRRRQF